MAYSIENTLHRFKVEICTGVISFLLASCAGQGSSEFPGKLQFTYTPGSMAVMDSVLDTPSAPMR